MISEYGHEELFQGRLLHMNWDDDELRRAYDRGYWDARREMEHHLRRDHFRSNTSQREDERYGDYGRSGSRGTMDRGYGGDEYRYGSADSREWNNDTRFDSGNRDYPPGDRNWSEGRHERGPFERAGDEVRSWFGDEEAAHRRRMDDIRDIHSDRYGYDRVFEQSDYYHHDREDDSRRRNRR
jgi:hypothetical protein